MADNEYRRLAPRGCDHCAQVFTPTQEKGRYCGKVCKVAGWRAAHPSAVARQREAAARKPVVRKVSAVYFNTCTQCGRGWTSQRPGKLCSDTCDRAKARADADKRARAAHIKAGRVVVCTQCAAHYCPLYGAKPSARPLCMVCRRVRAKEIRHGARSCKTHEARAKHYGVTRHYFNPRRVLERDGWACQLCGIPTPRELRGTTAPNAPELDHITPLSCGGPHTMANCQCACRACNGAKGADASWRPASRAQPSPMLAEGG